MVVCVYQGWNKCLHLSPLFRSIHAAVQGVLAQGRCAMGLVWWDKDTQLLRGVQYLNVMKNLKGGKKKPTKNLKYVVQDDF
jgi:hypothetical protein